MFTTPPHTVFVKIVPELLRMCLNLTLEAVIAVCFTKICTCSSVNSLNLPMSIPVRFEAVV